MVYHGIVDHLFHPHTCYILVLRLSFPTRGSLFSTWHTCWGTYKWHGALGTHFEASWRYFIGYLIILTHMNHLYPCFIVGQPLLHHTCAVNLLYEDYFSTLLGVGSESGKREREWELLMHKPVPPFVQGFTGHWLGSTLRISHHYHLSESSSALLT